MIRFVSREGTDAIKHDALEEKFGHRDLLPLWVADMEIAAPACVTEALNARAMHPIYGYTRYSERYYEAIITWYKRRYDIAIEKEWIVPAHGVVTSLYFAVAAYTRQAEGVVIQPPIYPPFRAAIVRQRRHAVESPLQLTQEGYRIDFEALEAAATSASMLMLCSPHNPTGRCWSDAELARMVDICTRHDLTLICDEIHADIVYKPFRTILHYRDRYPRIALFHAPSKSFNIAGLNSSFAIIPDRTMREAYVSAQARSGLSLGNPFGITALIAAYESGEVWLEALREQLYANHRHLKQRLEQSGVPIAFTIPEATFLAWLDCRAMGLDHKALEDFFYQEAKVGLNSGREYGKEGEGFMRFNVACETAMIDEAVARIEKAYKGS